MLTRIVKQGISAIMKRFLFITPLCIVFFVASTWGGEVRVVNGGGSSKDLAFLQSAADESLTTFERAFGHLNETLTVVYGASPCLHLGYHFELRQVQLCKSDQVIDAGSESVDVIHHELFHAMLCAWKPGVCASEVLRSREGKALHEGLADFFAHSLVPDELFGEQYSTERPYLRKYRTDVCYSLVEGAHEKSSAITNALITSGRSLGDIREFLEEATFSTAALFHENARTDPCFQSEPEAPAIAAVPRAGAASKLNRYKVDVDTTLELQFLPNTALLTRYPDFQIKWDLNDSAVSESFFFAEFAVDPFRFAVIPLAADAEKITALFYSDGKRVGSRAFYFTNLRKIRGN